MEFGLFFLMQRDEAWSERSVYDSGLEQMLAAESLGYSSVWIAEHHFNDYGLCPAPQCSPRSSPRARRPCGSAWV
jgi:alkanesulfonate monooxygenase SsuD/methylene tetrahydromethanopterin reductase-like flavin-dependent oxidoreductase (luciferase family)